MLKIAVIGAGISGLSLARQLNATHCVDVFEKARGVSGRLATHYHDDFVFDHGAIQFSVRDPRFITCLNAVSDASAQPIVHEWSPVTAVFNQAQLISESTPTHSRCVSAPKMNALCKQLSHGLSLHVSTHIETLNRVDNQWHLVDLEGRTYGPYDWVVSSAPSVQTAQLFNGHTAHGNAFDQVRMSGCYSLMLGLSELASPTWQVAEINDAVLSKISLEHSKPLRTSHYSVLIQSSNAWADEMMEADSEDVMEALLEHAQMMLPIDRAHIVYHRLQRWRYANVEEALSVPYWLDSTSRLAACGDWCIEGRVESAFISGYELADCFNQM